MSSAPTGGGGPRHLAAENVVVSGPGGSPVPPLRGTGRLGRWWHRAYDFGVHFMVWCSTIGTILMVLYQFLYPWGHWLPFGWNAESAWVGAFIMLVIYVVSKLPHLWEQEPGDTRGLMREVILGILNLVMVVIFLTRAYAGMKYPANAIGISLMHLVGFVVLILWQIQTAMRLTARTWSDQSGSVGV